MISLDDKMRTGLAWQEEQEYKVCFSGYPKYIFEKMPTNFKNFALSLKKQNITI